MSTPADKIAVDVESELEPLVPEFLANRKNDCTLVETLLAAGAFGDIRTIGHRMKGAGGSYGFDEISEIGETLEHAAVAEERQTIMQAVARLEAYLGRVEVTYV